MATKKTTTKKAWPGRPRKNVIWWKKTTSGPGRPRKNIILTKEERQKNATKKTANKKPTTKKLVTKKAITKKPVKKATKKKPRKKPTKKATTKKVTKKITNSKPNNKKVFSNHKINENKTKWQNNFAVRLLIFSFLLFSFSVYKAFFTNNTKTDPNNATNYRIESVTTKQKTPEVVTIQSYKDVMEKENTGDKKNTEDIKNREGENNWSTDTKTPEIIITPHTFTRAFNKDESNEEIKILQKFLYSNMLYTGNFEWINDVQTREAIYNFQLKYAIITPQDPINLRGYFWPSTRAKINALMPKE